MKILYEDSEIIVVKKPAGIESQSSRKFEPDMVSEIKNYLYKLCITGGEPYVGVIHRLDKPVGGILVYAKTPQAAKALSMQIQNGNITKKYCAVVCGKPVDNMGNFVDYLLKDGRSNLSTVVDKKVKEAKRAELSYRVLDCLEKAEKIFSLVEVDLKTGRHHQIRVQFSGHGTPLFGDMKYGGEGRNLALFACELSLIHPKTGKKMVFHEIPDGEAFRMFSGSYQVGENTYQFV